MFLRNLFLFVIGILLTSSVELFGQNKENDTIRYSESVDKNIQSQKDTSDLLWKPCISPFIELFGKGFISINVDFRRKETYAISIGVAGIEEGVSPNIMGYYFTGKRHRIETGGGISGNFLDETFKNIMIHGVFGYRYQKKKGLFFRAGFTPMFVLPFTDEDNFAFIPWAGVSLGYSF